MRRRHLLAFSCFVFLVPAGPASARQLGERPLARGSQGFDVRTLQRALTALGYPTRPADGIYGRRTTRSVRAWQRARHLRRDGSLTATEARRVRRELMRRRGDRRRGSGGATLRSLRKPPARKRAPKAPEQQPPQEQAPALTGAVGPGVSGALVAQVQNDLTRLGFQAGIADGVYGEGTAGAIRAYQAAFFASQTGVLSETSVARLRRRVESVPAGVHTFPIQGSWSFSGRDGRYGDDRADHVHAGQDLPAPAGTALVAVTSGVVSKRAFQRAGAGHYVVLQGDDGIDYVYMHMREESPIRPGERVSAGQRVGVVGSTGRSTGPHLHLELWTARWAAGGQHFDPLPALLAWR